jgi:hypothetical protein
VAAYISGAAYILVSYTIRIVLYGVVYAAAWVFIVGLVLDDRSERFFKRESTKRESMPEQGDEAAFPMRRDRIKVGLYLSPERVNQ